MPCCVHGGERKMNWEIWGKTEIDEISSSFSLEISVFMALVVSWK